MAPVCYDVAVIGAGLAGLTAAVAAQKAGLSTVVLERRDVVGGLCGTVVLDGYEFTLGANDFGAGLQRRMRALGVGVDFAARRSVFRIAGRVYAFPPTPRTLLGAARCAPDLLRLARALKAPDGCERFPYLEQLVQDRVRGDRTRDLVGVLAYPLGAAACDLPTRWIQEGFSKAHDYGTDKTVVPIGGPRRLAEQLAATLVGLGGRIETGAEVREVERTAVGKAVRTGARRYEARTVISSQGRLERYPPGAKACLSLGMIHLAVHGSFTYPQGVHTLAHFPPGVLAWLARLDSGDTPQEFGFHVFPGTPPDGAGYLPLNVCFLTARGQEDTGPAERARITSYVLGTLPGMLPGLVERIEYLRFVSPREYEKLHGLSSRPLPALPGASFVKPDSYDPVHDVHHVGNSVQPAGEHAGGAVLSGLLAADAVRRRLTP